MRATKSVRHDSGASAAEPARPRCWAQEHQLLKLTQLPPALHNNRGHLVRSPCVPTREQLLLAAMKTQHTHKYINKS